MLAQATQRAPHSLYREWGLITVFAVLIASYLPLLYWQIKKSDDEAQKNLLGIRSALATMFQETIVGEVIKLFQLINDNLPCALSQSESEETKLSALDKLCQGLKELDEDAEDRVAYEGLIENALSDIIVREATKMLLVAEANSEHEHHENAGRGGFRISFEGETEIKLRLLAENTVQARRRYDSFSKWKRRGPLLSSVAIIIGLLCCSIPFFRNQWMFIVGTILIPLFFIALIAAVVSILQLHLCSSWLKEKCQEYRRPGYWKTEIARSKKI